MGRTRVAVRVARASNSNESNDFFSVSLQHLQTLPEFKGVVEELQSLIHLQDKITHYRLQDSMLSSSHHVVTVTPRKIFKERMVLSERLSTVTDYCSAIRTVREAWPRDDVLKLGPIWASLRPIAAMAARYSRLLKRKRKSPYVNVYRERQARRQLHLKSYDPEKRRVYYLSSLGSQVKVKVAYSSHNGDNVVDDAPSGYGDDDNESRFSAESQQEQQEQREEDIPVIDLSKIDD